MNELPENIELFEAYLAGELSTEERDVFERRLQEDPVLVEGYELFKEGIHAVRREGFREEVQQFMQSKKSRKTLSGNVYWVSGIAASIVIALVVAFWPATETPEDLFLTYYEPYPNVLVTRNVGEDKTGYQAYGEGEFDKAVELFEAVGASSDTLRFYLGLSYLELGQSNMGIQTLEGLDPSSIFWPQKTWYLGLMYLKIGDKEQARRQFHEIGEGAFMFEAARELLGKLD